MGFLTETLIGRILLTLPILILLYLIKDNFKQIVDYLSRKVMPLILSSDAPTPQQISYVKSMNKKDVDKLLALQMWTIMLGILLGAALFIIPLVLVAKGKLGDISLLTGIISMILFALQAMASMGIAIPLIATLASFVGGFVYNIPSSNLLYYILLSGFELNKNQMFKHSATKTCMRFFIICIVLYVVVLFLSIWNLA